MIDPEELISCPYDALHKIRRKRMQFHIYKCKRQNANKATAVCPFNTQHIVHELEMRYHQENCPDKLMFTVEAIDFDGKDKKVGNGATELDSGELENWENEIYDWSYNPLNYCLKNDILRQKNAVTASERRQFRDLERIRLKNIFKAENGGFETEINKIGNEKSNNEEHKKNYNEIQRKGLEKLNSTRIIDGSNRKIRNAVVSSIVEINSVKSNEMAENKPKQMTETKPNQVVDTKPKHTIETKPNQITETEPKPNQTKLEMLANLRRTAHKVKMGNNKDKCMDFNNYSKK